MAAKTSDVPQSIRGFHKAFQKFTYRYETSQAFSDYLDYVIYVFNTERDVRDIERLKEYYKEYYNVFTELFHEHVLAMQAEATHDQAWFDLLGTYYEAILSQSKAQAFGQFFTPPAICNMMARLNNAEEEKGKGKRVSDPASGSGRTLLAFNAIAPGNLMYGDDLDPMCAKMCAINFAMHGVVGQVCCTNSLWPEDWRFGYAVNAKLYSDGLISIHPLQKWESYSYKHWINTKVEERPDAEVKQPVDQPKQLTIF